MKTNGESKFSYLLIGLGLGAIGALMFALVARQETREIAAGLAESAGEETSGDYRRNRRKRKELVSHRCGSVAATAEAEKQAYQEERRETLGGWETLQVGAP